MIDARRQAVAIYIPTLVLILAWIVTSGVAGGSASPSELNSAAQPGFVSDHATPVSQQRQPALTMSYRGAAWLERAERDVEERPEEVLDALGLRAGDRVADIGVGSGYFARRIARRVGPDGKVYGVDIQPQMLDILMQRADLEGITNIEPVLGDPDDLKLPPGSLDWMLLADVYHEISEPQAMLGAMSEALRLDGKVALLEYRAEDGSADHIKSDHRMSVRQVLAEWLPAGFQLIELHEFLPSQHLFVFSKTPSIAATAASIRALDDGVGTPVIPALNDYDMSAALEQRLVEVEVIGAGRDRIEIKVRSRIGRRMVVTLAAGTLFEAPRGSRDMLTRRDAAVLLTEQGWTNWSVRAVATGWEGRTGDDGDRFEIGASMDDELLSGVARALQAGTYFAGEAALAASYVPPDFAIEESAVWIAARDPTYAELSRALGGSQQHVRLAAAFGLVLCDRAGMDVSRTQMWDQRRMIFEPAPNTELRSWYEARSGRDQGFAVVSRGTGAIQSGRERHSLPRSPER